MTNLSFSQKLFVHSQRVLPHHLLSRTISYLADSRIPWLKNFLIRQFIAYFEVDMRIAEKPNYQSYVTFNDFFTRALADGARPIDSDKSILISPADGAVSQLGNIENNLLLQAKDRLFSLDNLVANATSIADLFRNGQFVTLYLSPKDYHRVHMPLAGRLKQTIYVPGRLFSVNKTTSQGIDNLFARNERLICLFETQCGPMAVILVGAMIVAGIETAWAGQITPKPGEITTVDFSRSIELKKGDEMGRFKLGSTVILLLPEATLDWHDSMTADTAINMGQCLATVRDKLSTSGK